MAKIFDSDSSLMRFLSRMADLMILNILTMLLCIPVITGGAAIKALYYVSLKMARKEEGYIIKPYFKAFREGFKKSLILWLLYLATAFIFGTDFYVLKNNPSLFPSWLLVAVAAAGIVIVLLLFYVFPLHSHFEASVKDTIKNSAIIAIGKLPRTLLCLVIWIIPLAVFIFAVPLWPILVMFGISLPAYISAMIYSPIFRKFEPEEEEVRDEDFSIDLSGEESSEE